MKSGGCIATLVVLAGCAETVARTEGRDVVEVVARDVAHDAGEDGAVDAGEDAGVDDASVDAPDAPDAPDAGDVGEDAVDGDDVPDPRVCESAPWIGSGQTRDIATGFEGVAERCGRSGRLRFYRVRVPGAHRLAVGVTPEGAEVGALILPDCAATRCLPRAHYIPEERTAASWVNPDLDPRDVVIAVQRPDSASRSIAVDLDVRLVSPASNGLCANAEPVAPGETAVAQLSRVGQGADRCDGERDPAVFFRTVVPAGQRLWIEADPSDAGDTQLRMLDGCEALRCIGANRVTSGGPRIACWTNDGGAPREVLFAASRSFPEGPPSVAFRTSLETPAQNGRCASALPVTSGRALAHLRDDDAVEPVTACGDSLPALYFSVEVGAGRRLTAWANEEPSGAEAAVRVIDGCGGACLARSLLGTLRWENAGPTRAVIVALSSSTSRRRNVSYALTLGVE